MKEEEIRREKAKNLRYKKPAVNGLTLFQIEEDLNEMQEACDEVVYFVESDMDSLIEALDGDCEEANQFRFNFSDLSAEVDQMSEDLRENWQPERFDDIMVACGAAETGGDDNFLMGYDNYEGDYFGINPFHYEWAKSESVKRLKRLTKDELLENVAQTLKIVFAYIQLKSRYQDLKAAMDILRAVNREYLEAVKRLDELHESIDKDSKANREFDSILEKLPQEAWL